MPIFVVVTGSRSLRAVRDAMPLSTSRFPRGTTTCGSLPSSPYGEACSEASGLAVDRLVRGVRPVTQQGPEGGHGLLPGPRGRVLEIA